MRKLFIILLMFPACMVYGTNYYVKSTGNDAGLGLADGSAWQTISKVNSAWASGMFKPGDSILFRRGDTFFGTLKVKESGSSGNAIVIGSYGVGRNPVISGFVPLTNWTLSSRPGIYYSVIKCESSTNNIVTIDGVNTPMGRWPDTGWRTYETFSGAISITDDQLTDSTNWSGAELVFRKSWWTLERVMITSHRNRSLYYNSISSWTPKAGYGYFVQNDIKALNRFGDWCFDGDTVFMYFGTASPEYSQVRISSLNKLLTSGVAGESHFDFITLCNISFEGSSISTIELVPNTKQWTIINCELNFSGKNCIDASLTSGIKIIGNRISNTNNNAIRFISSGNGNVVRKNAIENTGIYAGMMYSDDDAGDAIVLKDDGLSRGLFDTITFNSIINTGHSAIRVRYNNYYIANNYIDRFALTKNDAGGVYTWGVNNVIIKSNIILNGFGESGGCGSIPDFAPPDPYFVCVNGIYLDEKSSNISIINNTTAFNRDGGIYIQMASNITVLDNTSFDNHYFQVALVQRYANSYPVRNITMKGNKFISRQQGRSLFPYLQLSLLAMSYEADDIKMFGSFDFNYYARPIDQDDICRVYVRNPYNPWNGTGFNISGWKKYSGQDANSCGSGATISSVSDITLIYNKSDKPKVFSLSLPMKDVAGIEYSGNILIKPSNSIVLMGKGSVSEVASETVPITPVFLKAKVENKNPDKIDVIYNVEISEREIPDESSFAVTVNGKSREISSVAISGDMVSLTMSIPVYSKDQILLSYTNNSVNKIRSVSGGIASSFGPLNVENLCVGSPNDYSIQNLSPNPNDGYFSVEYTIPIGEESCRAVIVNRAGSILFETILLSEERIKYFPLPYLKSGVYYLLLMVGNNYKAVRGFVVG